MSRLLITLTIITSTLFTSQIPDRFDTDGLKEETPIGIEKKKKDPEGNEIPCTSIFFMGRKCKEWGFVDWIQFQGYRWIHNEKYLRENK